MFECQDRACISQAQNSVKAGLLVALSAEPVTSVRRALSIVVATIAQTDVPAGEWPQLLPWLHHCTQSTSEAHRETALVLLCSLTETIGAVLADLFWNHMAVMSCNVCELPPSLLSSYGAPHFAAIMAWCFYAPETAGLSATQAMTP